MSNLSNLPDNNNTNNNTAVTKIINLVVLL